MPLRLKFAGRLLPHVCLALALLAAAELASRLMAGDAVEAPAASVPAKTQVRREGTQLRDEPGRMTSAGEQLTFIASDGARYIGLENLNLERIGKIIQGSADAVDWFVSGTVTEYQGTNYLLISRARRRMSAPQAPRAF